MSRSSRRGPWLPEEDATLIHLVRTQGPNNWVRISQHMQHRSPKQCRERFHQNLKPSLNHEPISAQEGEAIEQLVQEMGKRWAEIARRLGNRSDNAVKNWWNGSMNRRKRSTVQQGSASRTVGYRSQPIPATIPPPSLLQHHSYSHEQSATKMFPGPLSFQRNGLGASRIFEPEHRYSAPAYPRVDGPEAHTTHRPFSYPQYGHLATSTHHHNSASSAPSLGNHNLPRLHTWPSGPSEYQLPPLNFVEPPAPSPAESALSRTSSHQPAPSLISDNQSTCSISPKTVTSPRPDMPTSKIPSMEAWPDLRRRNSTGVIGGALLDSCGTRRHEDDLQIPQPASGQETSSETTGYFTSLPRPLSLPDPAIDHARLDACGQTAGSPGDNAHSPQQKDSRMAVSSLLK